MNMYHREKSFRRAIMLYKAPSNINQCKNFAEEVSQLTKDDIETAVNNSEYCMNRGENSTGNNFLKKSISFMSTCGSF